MTERAKGATSIMKVSMWIATTGESAQVYDAITHAVTETGWELQEGIQLLKSDYVVAEPSDTYHINDGYLTFTTYREEKE